MARAAALGRWGLLTALLTATACTAPSLRGDAARESPSAGPRLDVRNLGWHDVRIYVVRNGFARRLGTVTHANRGSFAVPGDLIGRSGVRFRIDPVGSRESHYVGPVLVGRDQRVELTVQAPLALSVVAVRPGNTAAAQAGAGRKRL